jgi:hypothetical protein
LKFIIFRFLLFTP